MKQGPSAESVKQVAGSEGCASLSQVHQPGNFDILTWGMHLQPGSLGCTRGHKQGYFKYGDAYLFGIHTLQM